MTKDKSVYLGDGLTAEYDGCQIRLYCERNSGTHEVFLDGYVMKALFKFIESSMGLSIKIKKAEVSEDELHQG